MDPIQEPILDVRDIQGNILRGFNTKYLYLSGQKIDRPDRVRPWMRGLGKRITSMDDVHQMRLERSSRSNVFLNSSVTNVAFSFYGLQQIGVETNNVIDGMFRSPMGHLAGSLGDKTEGGKPVGYVLGNTWDDTPDIVFICGSDDEHLLMGAMAELKKEAEQNGLREIYRELGAELPGQKEHFGFRDGISQVGPRGRLSQAENDYLTPRWIDPGDPRSRQYGKPGQALVWPGQFVFGYPTQIPNSWQTSGPDALGGEPWMRNGSYLVFRRLRQDVLSFRRFLNEKAVELTSATGKKYSEKEIGALIVGRWEDGTPLVINSNGDDPAVVADDMRINSFGFRENTESFNVVVEAGGTRTIQGTPGDPNGQRCPFFSHIRKVNPRDLTTDQGDSGKTLTFQMLRRGIPYGPPYSPDSSGAERGLLFLAYQTSIDAQFQVLNRLWMNNHSAPEAFEEGFDMLVGQNPAGQQRFFQMFDREANPQWRLETLGQWVLPTGGAFFFSPSISFFSHL